MPVHGFGGFFFRAQDPKALAEWYARHLAIGPGQDGTGKTSEPGWYWQTGAGPVVFEPYREDTGYWPAGKSFMLNLRVSDLSGLIGSLTKAGIAVETRAEWDTPETGRFARIHDPEGNPVELWEPPSA